MSLSSGASEISSLSMFVSFGATVRVGWPRLSPKKIRLHKVTSCGSAGALSATNEGDAAEAYAPLAELHADCGRIGRSDGIRR